MRRLLNILVVDSIRELIKYKSFFLLVAALLIADRVLRSYVSVRPEGLSLPSANDMDAAAAWVFTESVGLFASWLLDWRTLLIGGVLFVAKQITSMWPTNDMRMMHRHEGGKMRILHSLQSLRWQQFAWDAMAVSSVLTLSAVWGGVGYLLGLWVWQTTGSAFSLLLPGGMVGVVWPIGMAGFSYSSKLAVLSNGFPEKARLFFQLFSNRRVLLYSWVFYLARIFISLLFVLIIPIFSMLTLENFLLRIFIASISAAPAYSYVKMASFKFFLEVYRPYPEVRREYAAYYKTTATPEAMPT